MLTLFLNFPSVFFRRLISVFVVLNMFTMILIDPYHDGFLERYNSLVSLYASFNNGNYDYTNSCNNLCYAPSQTQQRCLIQVNTIAYRCKPLNNSGVQH